MEKVNEKSERIEKIELNFNDVDEVVKRIRDLTDDDIELLSNVAYCGIQSKYNKKSKTMRFSLIVHLFKNRVIDTISLTQKQFNIICATNNIEVDPEKELDLTPINAKIRFIRGIGSDTKEYRCYHLFPIPSNKFNIARNSLFFVQFIDQDRKNELLVFNLLGRIKFKKALENEELPIKDEELDY